MKYIDLVEILKSKGIAINFFSEEIGVTRQGLQKMLNKETISLNTIKKICQVLSISPNLFFDSANYGNVINAGGHVQNGNGNKMIIESKEREIELLKQQLQDKDEIIRLLKESTGNKNATKTQQKY